MAPLVAGLSDQEFCRLCAEEGLALHEVVVVYQGVRTRRVDWHEDVFRDALHRAKTEAWPMWFVWPYYDWTVEVRQAREKGAR